MLNKENQIKTVTLIKDLEIDNNIPELPKNQLGNVLGGLMQDCCTCSCCCDC